MIKSIRKKPPKRPRCTKCKKQFPQKNRERRCYSCKVISPLWNSTKGKFLLDHVKRTGYLDCIKDVNLVELFNLHTKRTRFIQYSYDSESKEWSKVLNLELCHLQPAKIHNGKVGQLSPSNLVIAPTAINRRLGSTHFHSVGVSVTATTLIPDNDRDLKRAILKVADTTGLDSYKFTAISSEGPKASFNIATGDTYSDVLLSECKRLHPVAEDDFDWDTILRPLPTSPDNSILPTSPDNSKKPDSRLSVLNNFLNLLRGTYSTDIPFTLDKDEILYCRLGDERYFDDCDWEWSKQSG